MKLFRTFCIVNHQETSKIEHHFKNDSIFRFQPDVTKRFWQSQTGQIEAVYKPGTEPTIYQKSDDAPQNEVLIVSGSEADANRIVATIHGGILLANPMPDLTSLKAECHEYEEEKYKHLYTDPWYAGKFTNPENVYFGTLVWDRSKADKSVLYAIEKYKFSLSLDSITPHSTQPHQGQIFPNYDAQYSYHTQAAFAIIAAFSAIEELQLEITSSEKKPRWEDKDKGKWNPIVLEETQKKLSDVGIPPTEKIDWIFRGAPTKVEEYFVPYLGQDVPHHDGKNVRDRILTIPEAIHYASYLRNYIAAHRFRDHVEFISPYDVFNIQNISRRLILGKLGLWQYWVT